MAAIRTVCLAILGSVAFGWTTPDSSLIMQVRTAFAASIQLIQSDDCAMAMELLNRIRPPERLAQIYKAVLAANASIRLSHFSRADSLFQTALSLTNVPAWTQYLHSRRLQLYSILKLKKLQRRAFLTEQRQAGHPDSLKISIVLEQLRLEDYTGHPGRGDTLLIALFQLDNLDQRLDSIYQLLAEQSLPGQRFPEAELAIARFEGMRGKYEPAIKRCFAIAKKTNRRKTIKAMRLFHPKLHYKKGKYAAAIAYYRKYLRLYGNHPEVLLQIARAHKKLGQMTNARNWYDRFTKTYPRHSKTEEIFWTRAWDAEIAGKYQRALAYYNRLLPRFQKRKRGRWARFRIGYVYYKLKQFDEAIVHFATAEGYADGRSPGFAAAYWRGRALENMGKLSESREQFVRVYQIAPFNYYGHMARKWLEERKLWRESDSIPGLLAEPGKDSLDAWIRSLPGDKKTKVPWESHILPIADLLTLGQDTLAELTFDAAYLLHKDNPWFLYVFAATYRDAWGDKSYRLARRLGWKIDFNQPAAVPLQVMQLIFPEPFPDIVSQYARKEGINKFFLYSLMKQESGFMPRVISRAGAVGLMQIMPSTGRRLAEEVGLENFKSADLRNPVVNIRLGTRYIHNLKEKYDRDQVLVLCNYNAGPGPTARWKKRLDNRQRDSFIEDISYWETRDYVKKVLSNFWNYILINQRK
jgi:tetratricopeptide (TPR) repeat protein